jgi:hypothetical protein
MGRPAPADLLDQIAASSASLDAAAGPAAQVVIDGIEVTQSVQDHLNTVPLVAGKRTVVRVYLSYAPGPVTVQGLLRVARSASGPWLSLAPVGPAALAPSRSGSTLAALRSRRHDLAFSLNFVLPSSYAAAGSLWIRLGSVRSATGVLPLKPRPDTTVKLTRTAPLRVHLVRIRYSTSGPTPTYLPSALDIDLIRSWLGRAYPTAKVTLTTTTIDAPHAAPFHAAEINARLIALRATDVAGGTDGRTHYYGLVADGGGFMRGLASDIPATPAPGTVASGPTGPSTFGWDGDGSYGDWYTAHELGHTFGRYHAEFCGAGGGSSYPFANGQLSNADGRYVGLDVGDVTLGLPMRALPGATWHDVMTYCERQWLSSFTYGGIRTRLIAENALAAGAPAPGDPGADAGDAVAGIHVVAAANLTRSTGSLSAVMPSSREPSPPDDADGREPFSLVLTTARGRTLLEQPVPFRPSACELPGDDLTGTIDVVVPAAAQARRIELRHGGKVLDSRPIGGSVAPAAGAGDALRAGLRVTADDATGEVVVEWDAPRPSAGRRYLAQASEDDGATWRTVGLDLAEPAVRIDPDDFPGRHQVLVRVTATTGADEAVVAQDRVPLV